MQKPKKRDDMNKNIQKKNFKKQNKLSNFGLMLEKYRNGNSAINLA